MSISFEKFKKFGTQASSMLVFPLHSCFFSFLFLNHQLIMLLRYKLDDDVKNQTKRGEIVRHLSQSVVE